jgi:hypothetical protein
MRYSRWSPFDQLPLVIEHVRAHLSAVCSPDDDPDRYAGEVETDVAEQDGGMLVTGYIARGPAAAYLRDGFDPEADVDANPLTVPSIQGEGGGER